LYLLGAIVGSPVLGACIYMAVGLGLIALGWVITGSGDKKQPARDNVRLPASPAGQSSVSYYDYAQGKFESYQNSVAQQMMRNGFESIQFSPDTQAYYKKDFRSSTEFYFVLGRVNSVLKPEKVQAISQRTFDFVSKRKKANVLYCYPVIVAENIPAPAQKFIRSYNPKHFSQFEFPVIVDLSSRKLYYYTGIPIWGTLMYGPIRENADLLLGFPKM